MGIPGIYQEIGPGKRISLTKLSIETYESKGRPLRLAIDISIWNFQAQLGQGGQNPALRVLYYRLLRLLSTSVQAVFVFDGPKRPQLKRGRKVVDSDFVGDKARTKRLIKLMGFEVHQAPGEAEAECAVLQKEGVVDAVLSEDVDTLMFGSGITLRDWSSEGGSSKEPTHVSVYDAEEAKEKAGLDREGMILVALMSGGDYDPDGLPKCGAKIACEAAKAGFGKSLCDLDPENELDLIEWRRELQHELNTNESKFFRTKHKSITIPEDWPKKEILAFYTHPAVSSPYQLTSLKAKLIWNDPIDLPGLHLYVDEVFAWSGKTGAKKMLRGLAPAVLVYKLREREKRRETSYGDLIMTAANEMEYVREVTKERKHFSTGGIEELRVTFQPCAIVPWDLDAEPDDEPPPTQAVDEGDDSPIIDRSEAEDKPPTSTQRGRSRSPVKKDKLKEYDPTQLQKLWIPRTIVKVGVPLKVEDYDEACMAKEAARNSPKKPRARAQAAKKAPRAKGGMKPGALECYLRVTKQLPPVAKAKETSPVKSGRAARSSPVRALEPEKSPLPEGRLPPVFLAPSLEGFADFRDSPPLVSSTRAPVGAADEPYHVRPRKEYWKTLPPPRHSPASKPAVKPTFSGPHTKTVPISAFFPTTKSTSAIKVTKEIGAEPTAKRGRQPSPPLSCTSSKPEAPAHEVKRRAQEPLQRSLSAVEAEQDLSSDEDTLPPLSTMLKPKREKGLRRSYSEADASLIADAPVSPRTLSPTVPREAEVVVLSSSPLGVPPLPLAPRLNRLPASQQDSSKETAKASPERRSGLFAAAAAAKVNKLKKKKTFIAPRESLPGGWKEYSEQEMEVEAEGMETKTGEEKRGYGKERMFYRMSGVEVLDLTGDD